MREYLVIYEKGGSGWGAYAPDLPGLGATAETLEQVKKMIAEGIEFHIESLLEHGDPVPEPHSHAGTIQTDIVATWSRPLAKSA